MGLRSGLAIVLHTINGLLLRFLFCQFCETDSVRIGHEVIDTVVLTNMDELLHAFDHLLIIRVIRQSREPFLQP